MKKTYTFCLTVTALFLIQPGFTKAYYSQQTDPISIMQGRFSELTLRITSTKPDFVQLEPIPITVSLRNQTDKPILGHNALDFASRHIVVHIRNGHNEEKKVDELSVMKVLIQVDDNPIFPGEGYTTAQLLELDLGRAFEQHGTYHLKVTVGNGNWTETVESDYITVNISAPQGIDRNAAEFMKKSQYAAEFLCAAELFSNTKYRQEFEEFESKFSESVYGKYAMFRLASYYFYKGEHSKARERFDKLAKKPNFIYAEKVKDYLAKIESKASSK